MQLFQITSPFVQFHSGALRLTDEQARVRLGSITPTKEKGVYLIDSPVGFKRGEVIGFDGEMSRMLQLELVEKTDKPGKFKGPPENTQTPNGKGPQPKKWTSKPTLEGGQEAGSKDPLETGNKDPLETGNVA